MARRIPLPRLTRRQRTARWQRERRQQAITVTPEAIDTRYADDFGQFRSRHILITINKDAPDQAVEEANALAKAIAIRDQLRQDPSNQNLWNQLAKDQSQDPGSAASGGERGWVGKGQFVKPFEDAARALAIG